MNLGEVKSRGVGKREMMRLARRKKGRNTMAERSRKSTSVFQTDCVERPGIEKKMEAHIAGYYDSPRHYYAVFASASCSQLCVCVYVCCAFMINACGLIYLCVRCLSLLASHH